MPRRACQFTGSGQIRLLVMTLYFLMVLSPAIVVSQAQIAPSVTPGGDLGTKAPQSHPISVNIQGHHYDTRYDISGGTPKGENLFHSFESFSVPESAIAIFLNSHPGQHFQNIISRVIGDGTNPITASQLLGRIDTATNFSSANFWLINPAGIVIGPNAVFNIAGTINLASANYLQLGRERFNAANESISGAVLKANPTAWGFLGATPTSGATIQLNGGQFNNGQTLTVVGRDSQAGANGIEVGGSITIPGGTVKLGSVGKLASGVTSGEMTVDSLTTTGFAQLGSVRMTGSAEINVNQNTDTAGINVKQDTGGSVFIRGHELVMEQKSRIDADTINGQGGGIDIEVHNLTLTNARLSTRTLGSGNAGNLIMNASGTANLADSLILNTVGGNAKGTGGEATIKAGTLTMTNSTIDNGNFSSEGGNPGSLIVDVGILKMSGRGNTNATIYADTFGPKNGAAIRLNVRDTLTMDQDALINAISREGATGKAGDVTITAGKFILGTVSKGPGTILLGTHGVGHAGNLIINVKTLEASAGSRVFSGSERPCPTCSLGAGNAGIISIQGIAGQGSPATSVTLDGATVSNKVAGGQGKAITVTADRINLFNGATITADTTGGEDAGTITLRSERLLANVDLTSDPSARKPLENVSNVEISSSTTGSGSAGIITFEGLLPSRSMTELAMAKTRVETEAGGNGTTGPGGAIRVNAPSGTVNLYQTVFSANVAGGTDQFNAPLNAPPPSPTNLNIVDGGLSTANITVTTKDLAIKGGGFTAQTSGGRQAGNIALNVDSLKTEKGSIAIEVVKGQPTTDHVVISSSSLGAQTTGNAGQIRIGGTDTTASQLKPVSGPVSLSDTDISTASLGTGAGGPITIRAAGDVTLTDTVLSANVNNGPNDPSGVPTGNILVTTPKHLSITGGGITAETTGSRHAGNISLSVGSLTTAKGSISIQPPKTPENQKKRVLISSSSTGRDFDEINGIYKTPATGNAGTITIRGVNGDVVPGPIELSDTNITTEAKGTGAGGQITIGSASSMVMTQSILSATVRNAGNAAREASIQLTTPSLAMTGGGLIAQTHGTGHAGNITLNVGSLTTVKGSAAGVDSHSGQTNRVVISSSSTGFDANDDGSVLGAKDILATGNAGTITIRGLDGVSPVAGTISLSDANIVSRAIHTGEGGTISIASNQALTLKDVFLSTSVNNFPDSPSGVPPNSTTQQTIRLTTPDLRISGRDVNNRSDGTDFDQRGGEIVAETLGARDAGKIVLNVGQLTIDQHPVTKNGVRISSSSTGASSRTILTSLATGNAGTITIRGLDGVAPVPGPISIRGATIKTEALGIGGGGTISIQSSADIILTDTVWSANVTNVPSNVPANSQGEPTGNILVTTSKQLSISGGGITAQTTGSRHAGTIALSVGSLTTSKGDTAIEIVKGQPKTDRVLISSSSRPGLDTDPNALLIKRTATGNAGQVRIGGGVDSTDTILIAVPGLVSLSDTDISTAAEVTGLGGPITIRSASPMTMAHSTLSANVNNTATSDPSGANIELTAPSVTMTGGGITAQTTGSRNAGTITLNVDALTTQAGTNVGGLPPKRVQLSSSSTGSGDAGTVTIKGTTNAVTSKPLVLNNTDITTESNATGKGGSITIEAAEDIALTDTVLSANVNKGTDIGGVSSSNILVKTPKHLTIAGGGITAQTIGTRHAGQIDLLVGSLTTSKFQGNRVSISSSSLRPTTTGNAGQVRIGGGFDGAGTQLTAVPGIVSLGDTDISTAAEGTGLGGPITILASSPMTLTHSTLSANVHNTATSDPNGANILLTAPSVTMTGGGITAQTTGSRNAGTITLNVDALTTQAGTNDIVVGGSTTKRVQLSSSSTGSATQDGRTDGNAGNITIGGLRPASFPTTLTLADTTIETDAQRNGGGGTIVLGATGSAPLQMTRSIVSARVNEAGGTADLGSVHLTTGAFQLVDSTINVETIGSRNAGQLNVLFDTLSMGNSHMISQSTREGAGSNAGAGGSLHLKGTTIDLSKGSSLVASVKGGSNSGGNIDVTAPTVNIARSTVRSTTDGNGSGGTITLRTDNFSLVDQSELATTSGASASGPAGNVTIEGLAGGPIGGSLRLENSQIKTNAEGTGAGGLITVNSGIPVTLITGVDFLASVKGGGSSTNDPPSGITVTAPSLTILGGRVKAETNGTRNGGTITLTTQALTLDQDPTTGSPTIISTSSAGAGRAGSIFLTATSAPLSSPLTSSASSSVAGPVQSLAASGTSTSGSILVTGKSEVLTSSSGSGFGGNITMDAPNITLTNSAKVSASNANVVGGAGATGAAGSITMTAANQYRQSGGALVTTETQGAALKLPTGVSSGSIQISADGGDISLLEGAEISASSKNASGLNFRDAGSISLVAGRDIQMRSGATIKTDANAALGGRILLKSSNFFHAHDSTITSSVDGAIGSNAGTIDIKGQQFHLIENTTIKTTANQGDGGFITFEASKVSLIDPNSIVDVTSVSGRPGALDIQAPVRFLSGTIVPVRPFVAQAALSTDRCSADPAGKFSSFTQGKRDGLPQEPGRFAPSPLTLEQLEAPGQASGLNRPILQAKRLNVPMLTIAVDPQHALTSGMGCGGV